jgi:acyl-CoA reductase-like NAD-dependent aldehyde dehydrogenase
MTSQRSTVLSTASTGTASYDVINPATEEVIGSVVENTAVDAIAAAARAKRAQPAWATLPVEERAALLIRAADLLNERALEFISLVQAETGGTTEYVTTLQVGDAGARLKRFAEMGRDLREQQLGVAGAVDASVGRRPLGVVASITPYNVPLVGVTGKIGPALIMGNTVVIKPAVQSPLSAIKLVELLAEVGFPEGVINLVTGSSPEVSRALVASPDVDMISFTGSSRVGADIAGTAGPRFARLLLELGGKGAAVVLEDADLDAVVDGVSTTFSRYSGQVCTAPSRLLVHRSRYDEVVERLAERAESMTVGDPADPATIIGPVITAPHRQRVLGMIDRAVADGARKVAGAHRDLPGRGYYVAPTLLADAEADSEIMQEEVFGPVMAASAFDSIDEAIERTNGTRYGLTNYVWSGDLERGKQVARRLRSGSVAVNSRVARHPDAPFGGVGESGIGREGGHHSLWAYSEPESLVWSAS